MDPKRFRGAVWTAYGSTGVVVVLRREDCFCLSPVGRGDVNSFLKINSFDF